MPSPLATITKADRRSNSTPTPHCARLLSPYDDPCPPTMSTIKLRATVTTAHRRKTHTTHGPRLRKLFPTIPHRRDPMRPLAVIAQLFGALYFHHGCPRPRKLHPLQISPPWVKRLLHATRALSHHRRTPRHHGAPHPASLSLRSFAMYGRKLATLKSLLEIHGQPPRSRSQQEPAELQGRNILALHVEQKNRDKFVP